MLIDMHANFIKRVKSATARFQRNRDGQFVGHLAIEDDSFDCWLVFDDVGPEVKDPRFLKAHGKPLKDPAFLRLSFENPYPKKKQAGRD